MDEDDFENVSPASIHQIGWQAKDGEADPDEVRLLLAYFCRQYERKQPIVPELSRFLYESFRRYLDSDIPLERAFGLKGKPGRPKSNEQRDFEIARDIIRLYLEGKPLETARDLVGGRYDLGRTQTIEIWNRSSQDGLILLRLERNKAWTPKELNRLRDLFEGKPGFIFSSG